LKIKAKNTRQRLEVLTEFFNKKEASEAYFIQQDSGGRAVLQKQLGLQSVRCSTGITVIFSH
jgi:hypothetical protein